MRRHGISIMELSLSMALLVFAFVGVAQMLAVASLQKRESRWRDVAVLEVANITEQLQSLASSDLTAETLAAITLSEAAEAELPSGRVEAVLENETAIPNARRIIVSVDWVNTAGQRVRGVQLASWSFNEMPATELEGAEDE